MREQANAARLSIGSMVSPPTDNIPSPRKRVDFPQVFRHERTLANRLRETSRLPTATAPQGVHSQKQRQAAPTGDSHNDRPGHASIILAGPRSHCGISSRRPFLWLSTRTPLCRRPRSSSHRVGESARSTWILEGDIKACFDRISHDWLLTHIPMDQQLLRKWLKAGFLEKHAWFATTEGTPQGW